VPRFVNPELNAELVRRGLNYELLAAELNLSRSAVCKKAAGRRPWKAAEIEYLEERLGLKGGSLSRGNLLNVKT